MVKLNKLSSAINIALLATAIVALPGCSDEEGDEDNSTTTTTMTETNNLTGSANDQVDGLTATVTGTVQDTNGNPLADVQVFVLGRTTTTDAGGVYVFEDVPVTEVNLVSGANAGLMAPLKITVAAPTGFLGATVNVNTIAEIDGNIGAGSGGGFAPENPVTTVIDGYVAPAGVTVLPEYNSSLTGIARDSLTGRPVEGMEIRLDLLGVATGVGQEDIQNTLGGTSYATPIFSAVTDAEGRYSFPNLPGDALYNAYSTQGHTINVATTGNNQLIAQNGQLSTANEGAQVADLDVVVAVEHGDMIAPFVTNVDNGVSFINRVAPTRIPGGSPQSYMLARGIDGTAGKDIVLWFNEPVKDFELTENSVVVRVNSDYAEPAISLAADGMSLTLTFANAIPENSDIAIYLATVDFYDLGMNQIVEATTAGVNDWDVVNGITNNQKAVYIRYDLCTYVDPIIDAIPGTLVNQPDPGWGTDDNGRFTYSNAFLDIDGDWGHRQVNLDKDAYDRLTELAAVQVGAGAATVDSRALFLFTQDKAAYHTFVWTGGNINPGSSGVWDPSTSTWTSWGSNGGANDNTAPASGIGREMQVWVTEADANNRILPGQTLQVTSYDDFGVPTATRNANTQDIVKPTTVLQDAYGIPLQMVTAGSAGVAQQGDGGELSQVGAAGSAGGTPILGITIPLLDTDGDGILDELTNGWAYSATAAQQGNGALANLPANLYNTPTFNNFSDARTMAVAFSEDINLQAGTSPSTTVTGTTLTNWVENNNTQTINHDGGPNAVNGCATNGCTVYASDLVQFDVASVFTLANANHSQNINFTNAVADNFGNVADADTNAVVIVADYIPPMVVSASIDSDTDILTVTFNERINRTNSSIAIRNNADSSSTSVSLTASCGTNSPSLDNTGTVLTLSTTCFPAFSNALFDISLATGSGNTDITDYARLDFGQVRDMRQNYWDNVALHSTNGAEAANTNGGIGNNGQDQLVMQPDFALEEPAIPPFVISEPVAAVLPGLGDAVATGYSFTWNFGRPVETAQKEAADAIADWNTAGGPVQLAATGTTVNVTSVTWDTTNTQVRVVFETTTAVSGVGASINNAGSGFTPEGGFVQGESTKAIRGVEYNLQ